MPLIEGLGDEVTIILGALVILLVGLLAWFSTHTTDIPFVSVIIVELSQRASRNSNSANQGNQSHVGTTHNENEQQINANASDSLIGQSSSLDDVMNNAIDDMNAALGLDRHLEEDEEDEDEEDDGDEDDDDDEDEEDDDDDVIEEDPEDQDSVEIPAASPSQTVDESQTSTEETLRRRRLAFFENSQTSDNVNRPVSEGAERQTGGENSNVDASSRSRHVAEPGSVSQQDTNPRSHPQTGSSSDNRQDVTDPDSLQIRVRLKYLNDTQRLVFARPRDTIGVFRRTHFSEELSQRKLVRLIFNGQDLRNETSTLQACNIVDNSVLHCLVTQNVHSQPRQNVDTEDELNIGNFMLPVFGLLLGALWYLRFNYKQYFNAISTLSLAGISFLFIFAAFTSWRTNNTDHREDRHLD